MGDQGAHEAGIQAEQPQVVEEPNEAGAHPAQPQVAAAVQQLMVQQIPMARYQVPPSENRRMDPLDQTFRKISKSDWNRPKGRREPSQYFDFFDGLRRWLKGKFEAHFVVKRHVIFERAVTVTKFSLMTSEEQRRFATLQKSKNLADFFQHVYSPEETGAGQV